MGNVAQRLSPSKPQGAGVSPSSTAESANKAPIVEVPTASNSPSAGNVSAEKPLEQPQSSDTSYGVEATAVRKLAASTGTVAILGTTALTPTKENDPDFAVNTTDVQIVDAIIKGSIDTPAALETPEVGVLKVEEEKVPVEQHDSKVDSTDQLVPNESIESNIERIGSASSDSGRQVPQITETLVASLENSPVEELASRSSPDGAEPNSTDVSGIETQATRSTDIGSDDQIEESSAQHKVAKREVQSDEAKSDNNESASTKTMDNDISSEQMKTNSLSDISFSDLDDKEVGIAEPQPKSEEPPTKAEEPSGESDRSEVELKLVEITPDSASESSQQITKEESTSDITTDNQQEELNTHGDEERLISSPSDERSTDIEDDEENKRNAAAIKIQSSFRGFKVRKPRSPKDVEYQLEDQLEAQLTASEIEIVKEQVEGIIKEAEETTESLRNTPDVDEVVVIEEDFPAPPDDALLNQLNEDDLEKETQSLNIEPVPYPNADVDAPVKPVTVADTKSDSDEKQSPLDNDESTTAELARMTADEDLPAPDFELLESSCTEDLNTEVATSDKVLDDEPQDSTEGDVTIEEDSDKLKELQKPQVCDELNRENEPTADADADVAATKIQANVRGFLARKQVEQAKQEDEVQKQDTDEINENIKTDSPEVVAAQQQNKTASETKALEVVEDAAEKVAKETDVGESRTISPPSDTAPTQSSLAPSEEPILSSNVSEDKVVEEEIEQKISPTTQQTAIKVGSSDGGEEIIESGSDDKKISLPQALSSELSDLVTEPPEGATYEPTSILDEALDKMSSQSDSISQDTISQNTVEELLKQQDSILTQKQSIEEEKEEDAVLAPQSATDDRMEDDIIADASIKTLPESNNQKITKDADDGGKDQPSNIELVSEQPKAITPDITDKEGNENSSQSIEELSSNTENRESLNPSNENSTIDLPDLSSAEETKGSSTASITSDSAKEKTSDASGFTTESDSKAFTDIDIDENPAVEMKKSYENGEQSKMSSEPKEKISELVDENVAVAPSLTDTVTSADANPPSNNVAAPSEVSTSMTNIAQSNIEAPGAQNGKDEPNNEVKEAPITQEDSVEKLEKETKVESEPASLKNGSLPSTPSEMDDEILNNSATKIQANVRGYLSRKNQSTNQSEK